jgi:ubiquinone/menaquinone biosynthesis C-methylase UbiE
MLHEQEKTLTERQKNELEYHRKHAVENRAVLDRPFNWDVLHNPSKRWWNAYWQMFTLLSNLDLMGKRVLVVGCGFGDDALRLAKLGADVYAFDLSPDSLSIARRLADREGLDISFEEMPAEYLKYDAEFFDLVVARDILHHVEIAQTMGEIIRVSKTGALLVINEIYSHSLSETVRRSALVEKVLYPRMQRWVYGGIKPYITEDERKLTELDIHTLSTHLSSIDVRRYFNFLVTRIISDKHETFSKLDRALLIILRPFAPFLAGRILLAGSIAK